MSDETRPRCTICNLEDGACICAHIRPTRDGAEGAEVEVPHEDCLNCRCAPDERCAGYRAAPPKPAPDAMREALQEFLAGYDWCISNNQKATMASVLSEAVADARRTISAPVPPADEVQQQRTAMMLARSGAGAAEPVASMVSDEAWQRALDCAYSCLDKKFISKGALNNAMQHAFGMLSLRKATPTVRGDREMLRKLVDVVWNEATESTAVPSTKWADRLIDKVFALPVQSTARPDREAFYTILNKYIPQESIDQAWQELKEAAGVQSGAGERALAIETAAKIAQPWADGETFASIDPVDVAIIKVRTEIAASIRAISRQAPHSSNGTGK